MIKLLTKLFNIGKRIGLDHPIYRRQSNGQEIYDAYKNNTIMR